MAKEQSFVMIGGGLLIIIIGGVLLWQREPDRVNLSASVVTEQSPSPADGSKPVDDAWAEITNDASSESAESLDEPVVVKNPDEEKRTDSKSASTTEKSDAPEHNVPDTKSTLGIKDRLLPKGFAASTGSRSVDTVVIHSSYNSLGGDEFDIGKIVDIYESYGVSAHYLVGRDGAVYRLVRERDVAYHAGVSKMKDGRTNVNEFSIGIEMVGTKESGYTSKQYVALTALLEDIKSRYSIENIVGHDEIAPGRKTDPWQFDWSKIKR